MASVMSPLPGLVEGEADPLPGGGGGVLASDPPLKAAPQRQGIDKAGGGADNVVPPDGEDDEEGSQPAESEDPSGAGTVPVCFAIQHISTKVQKADLYTDLFVYIPFVIMFSFFAYGERTIDQSYYTTRMTKDVVLGGEVSGFEFIRTYEGLNDIDEWYAWMRTVFISNVFPETPPLNGTTRLQSMNYLLGSARVRTIRANNRSCEIDSALYQPTLVAALLNTSVAPCYGSYRAGEETVPRFQIQNPLIPKQSNMTVQSDLLYNHYRCSDIPGGQYIIGDLTVYHCGGYVVDIPFIRTQADVLRLMDTFQDPDTPFLDPVQTRFISVEFFLYTVATNTFTSLKLYAEMSPSGAFLPQYQARAFMIWTEDRSSFQTVYDFFFLLFVLYYVYRFVREWAVYYKTYRKVLSFVFSLWNILEFVNLVIFLAVFAMRWVWWDVSKQSRYTKLPYAPRYPEDLDALLTLWNTMVYLNVCNCVMVFLKILKYLRLNPRLGLLTLSIAEKKSQLLGVLGLFTWAVFTFAMSGYGLYGSTMYEFHTLAESYTTLLKLLVGDFRRYQNEDEGLYQGMRKENQVLAGIVFWAYVVLVFYILLNMVIAVLAEGFAVAHAQVADSSFADEVVTGVRSLLETLHPRRLKTSLLLRCAGTSIDDCLQLAILNLAEHQNLAKGEDADLDDDSVLIDRHRLNAFIGPEVAARLGEVYLDQLWAHIQQSFAEAAVTPEMLEEQDLQDMVAAATDQVILPVKNTIHELSFAVQGFNFEVLGLVEELRDRAAGIAPDFLRAQEGASDSDDWFVQLARPQPKAASTASNTAAPPPPPPPEDAAVASLPPHPDVSARFYSHTVQATTEVPTALTSPAASLQVLSVTSGAPREPEGTEGAEGAIGMPELVLTDAPQGQPAQAADCEAAAAAASEEGQGPPPLSPPQRGLPDLQPGGAGGGGGVQEEQQEALPGEGGVRGGGEGPSGGPVQEGDAPLPWYSAMAEGAGAGGPP